MGQKVHNYMEKHLTCSMKEGYAKKFQILCTTLHLKVEFHSGEAENGKRKVDHAHKSLVILFVQQKSLHLQIVAVLENKNVSRTCISGSVLKCTT